MDAELKGILTQLVAKIDTLATKDDIRRIEETLQRHGDQLQRHGEQLQRHGERLVAIEARLDEQRHTINALIPTRIAAVPPAAE